MGSKPYWVAFNAVKGIGAVRLRRLYEHFGSLEIAWQASSDILREAGIPESVAANFLKTREKLDPERYCSAIESKGIKILTWEDADYPERLKEIDAPPPVLYLRGEIIPGDKWAVAVVGTRRMTTYGKVVTQDLATFLAANGITVVSGLAKGVDSIAHRVVIENGGRTLSILGNGVDRIYPAENRQLAVKIMENGAIISDYAPGTPPDAANFPARNRIISGLCMATIVIEAGERSGALITATFAVEQGREVFSVPGNINAPQSKGTNKLIVQGAHPLVDFREILEILNLENVSNHKLAQAVLPENKIEEFLLSVVNNEPKHVDEITNLSGLPVDKVIATLTIMELKGLVRQYDGYQYMAVREEPGFYGDRYKENGVGD